MYTILTLTAAGFFKKKSKIFDFWKPAIFEPSGILYGIYKLRGFALNTSRIEKY